MQKIVRRAAQAKRQADRVAKAARAKDQHDEFKLAMNQFQRTREAMHKDVSNARRARREDWELGPLAPKRAVGHELETYGALSTDRLKGTPKKVSERLKRWTIAVGDRVVVVQGKDKGKIGEVERIDEETDHVIVEGVNMAEIILPEWAMQGDPDKRRTRPAPLPLPVSSVRLVYPTLDPETGLVRDTIFEKLRIVRSKMPWRTSEKDKRVVVGLGLEIPWPETAEQDHPVNDDDTLYMEVETQTWTPELLRAPLPDGVLDELRNKYSKFRTRHDPEYIAKKNAEAETQQNRQDGAPMRTPLQELRQLERKAAKSKGPGKLTDEMLATIGEMMASKRALSQTS